MAFTHASHEFGPFRLDESERILLRDGSAVPLARRAFDTLLMLVRNAGHVVRKQDLLREVWGGVEVEENNLAQCILSLRKALQRASSEAEHYIETIPGRGYRFAPKVLAAQSGLAESERAGHHRAFTHLEHMDGVSAESLARIAQPVIGRNGHAPHVARDLEAQRFYLTGRYFWNRMTERGLVKAVASFEQALAKDPGCVLGYVGMADACIRMGDLSLGPPLETFASAMALTGRALQVDDALPEAHATLGLLKMYFEWNLDGAGEELRRAVEMRDEYATAHHWYGWYLLTRGRLEEARAELLRAHELDPLNLMVLVTLGLCARAARRFEEAQEYFDQALDLDEGFALGHHCLGLVSAQLDECERAEAEFRRSLELDPASVLSRAALAHYLARWGRVEEALSVRNALANLRLSKYVCPYHLATIEAGLGNREEAFRLLESAFDFRSPYLLWMKSDPMLEPLGGGARLDRIADRVGVCC